MSDTDIDISAEIDAVVEQSKLETIDFVTNLYLPVSRTITINPKSEKYAIILSNGLNVQTNKFEEIKYRLFERNGYALEDFDFIANKIVIAGGAVLESIICPRYNYRGPKDFDLFFYDHNEESAFNVIMKLIDIIQPMSVVKNHGCITLVDNQCFHYQIVLRLYNTKSEIIHGFDLGASQFLYDGKQVFTTTLGNFALKYGLNIVNMNVRRSSYEKRIMKYVDKGFGLVLYGVDKSKILNATSVTLGKFIRIIGHEWTDVPSKVMLRFYNCTYHVKLKDNIKLKVDAQGDDENFHHSEISNSDLYDFVQDNFLDIYTSNFERIKKGIYSGINIICIDLDNVQDFILRGTTKISRDDAIMYTSGINYDVKSLMKKFDKSTVMYIMSALCDDLKELVYDIIYKEFQRILPHLKMPLTFEDHRTRTAFEVNPKYAISYDEWYNLFEDEVPDD